MGHGLKSRLVSVAELPEYLALHPITLGTPAIHRDVLVFVQLNAKCSQSDLDAARDAAHADQRLLVGTCETTPGPSFAALLDALTCTISASPWSNGETGLHVADINKAYDAMISTVAKAPNAALTLRRLLGLTANSGVEAGLFAESLAYSLLLAGAEFAQWRRSTPRVSRAASSYLPLIVERNNNCLDIALNRPHLHNCFGHDTRDSLLEALDVAIADKRTVVRLSGRGPSFCSGGCLDEFGTALDPVVAHLVRVQHSIAMRLFKLRDRAEAILHGACFGAGIEMPAFFTKVGATANASFQLPELNMGLIPGAGGTVSVTARIGRWRTAYLCLSGQRIDAQTALNWRLVDHLV